MTTQMEMDPKLTRLQSLFAEMGSVLVAYSGGLDSAFVLKVATDVLGARAVGMTAVSPSLAPTEKDDAVRIARAIGAHHIFVESNEIDDPNYQKNPTNRCYYCKSELYRITARKKVELGLAEVVNGTNLDDLGDYRPGLDAAREAEIRSPLVEAKFTKADVRRIAKELGMEIWDKPAAACLSSRLPYGTEVTRERLHQIGSFEADLKSLGLRQVRVRYHHDVARVEVAKDELTRAFELRDAIVKHGTRAGFKFVTLDLAGYRVGSLNALLPVLQERS